MLGKYDGRDLAEARFAQQSHLAFRDSPFDRQAYVLGTRLWVWEIMRAYHALGESNPAVSDHFEIDAALVEEALVCAELHSAEIEAAISRHRAITLHDLAKAVPYLKEYDTVDDMTHF